jgi:D-tagatose-1,6-bisphosphate aldolase subunit GatZ/KbaZ
MSKSTEYLRTIVSKQKAGIKAFIPSICSSNDLVLTAAVEYARIHDEFLLVECTANQVNQYGGYTGMRPMDFKKHVYQIADNMGFNLEKIIMGGDHLGPVAFKDKAGEVAMREAEGLISEYVKAGFEKIHIDTSMRLGDDPIGQALSDSVIASRSARLCQVAEETYQREFGGPCEILYVIGSEVPVPGGAQDSEEGIKVTSPRDFADMIDTFYKTFREAGQERALERIIAAVVQPGVEFGDDNVIDYDREKAKALTAKAGQYTGIILEAHSTDYQTKESLGQMAEDGFGILKVGPELTFALREGLFALQHICQEMHGKADFIGTLDRVMCEQPSHWERYFRGDADEVALKRKYSYYDRWRYYATDPRVENAIEQLFQEYDRLRVPDAVLKFYMPIQYAWLREDKIRSDGVSLAKGKVREVLEKYYEA